MSHVALFRRLMILGAFAVAGWVVIPVDHTAAVAEDKDREAVKGAPAEPENREEQLRKFMRKKLDASDKILEGLVTEDPGLVKAGAKALSEMGEAAEWRVSKDILYRQFSEDFLRAAGRLAEAAEKNDTDKALLRWMDTTMQCVECHRFVRDHLVVGQ